MVTVPLSARSIWGWWEWLERWKSVSSDQPVPGTYVATRTRPAQHRDCLSSSRVTTARPSGSTTAWAGPIWVKTFSSSRAVRSHAPPRGRYRDSSRGSPNGRPCCQNTTVPAGEAATRGLAPSLPFAESQCGADQRPDADRVAARTRTVSPYAWDQTTVAAPRESTATWGRPPYDVGP